MPQDDIFSEEQWEEIIAQNFPDHDTEESKPAVDDEENEDVPSEEQRPDNFSDYLERPGYTPGVWEGEPSEWVDEE